MKLKIFKNIDTEKLTNEEKLNLQIADNYAQHHGLPKTRREFLASGLKATAATIIAPTFIETLWSSMAHAATCGGAAASGPTMPAAVVINGAGGFSVAGNFVFMDEGNQPLSSYSRLGLGTAGAFNVDKTFGESGGNFADVSQLLSGIRTDQNGNPVATDSTLNNTACLGIACQSQDDTANNALNVTGMLAEVLKGEFLPVLGGNRNMPAVLPSPAPLNVSRQIDVENAVSVRGSIASMSTDSKSALFRSISRLTSSQARRMASISGGDALKHLSQSASQTNLELVSGTGGNITINPLDNNEFSTLWGVTANNVNTGTGGQASAVYNALVGNASMCNISIGGCDYHGNGRATQDAKDNEIGRTVGRVLESARILNRPVFVMVTTDGSVASAESLIPGAEFTSDSGTRSGMICFFYDPKKRPEQKKRQLGHFNAAQAAERNTVVGGSPMRGVTAAIVNYLSFAGRPDLIDQVTRKTFGALELDQVKVIFS